MPERSIAGISTESPEGSGNDRNNTPWRNNEEQLNGGAVLRKHAKIDPFSPVYCCPERVGTSFAGDVRNCWLRCYFRQLPSVDRRRPVASPGFSYSSPELTGQYVVPLPSLQIVMNSAMSCSTCNLQLAILHLKCNIAHHENALSDTVTGACA